MQLLESYFETWFDPSERLQAWRKKAWDRFLELGWPRPKQEAFQYLPLKDLSIPKPATAPLDTATPTESSLLFIDGYFQSSDLPQPLVCMKLDAAMLVYGVFLQNRIHRSLKGETDPFATLNGAFQGNGAFLYVPPHTHIEEPIEIHHRLTTSQMVSPRLQIFLGQGASLRIVHRIPTGVFWNSYLDVNLDAGAALFFGEKSTYDSNVSFQTFRSTLKRDSRLHYLSFREETQPVSLEQVKTKLARSSIKVQLLEENSEVLLQGLSQLDTEHESHTHSLVEHVAPHTRSRQHFKTILRGKSRSSFEGKILVRPEAQKTEAYQLNNNLLLSDEAFTYAKPNLEVFADDVKASHGATVSQLNEEELFYFRSRGFSLALAQEMLAIGFCNEILNAIPQGIFL